MFRTVPRSGFAGPFWLRRRFPEAHPAVPRRPVLISVPSSFSCCAAEYLNALYIAGGSSGDLPQTAFFRIPFKFPLAGPGMAHLPPTPILMSVPAIRTAGGLSPQKRKAARHVWRIRANAGPAASFSNPGLGLRTCIHNRAKGLFGTWPIRPNIRCFADVFQTRPGTPPSRKTAFAFWLDFRTTSLPSLMGVSLPASASLFCKNPAQNSICNS